jgi:quinol monooxygenase YgiN
MKLRFASQVQIALDQRDKQLAQDVYDEAAALPSLLTEAHYQAQGYQTNGPLFDGSGLAIYTKNSDLSRHVLKGLNESEARRLEALQEATPKHSNIVAFELWTDEAKGKSFMLMPALRGTLETIGQLSVEMTIRLWTQMSNALSYVS